MSALSEKIRKAREVRVEAGGKVFIVRRPTLLDMIEMNGKSAARAVLPFIVGWENVTGLDLYPGGDGAPAPFDADACAEWLADRVDLLSVIAEQAVAAYDAHRAAMEESAKN